MENTIKLVDTWTTGSFAARPVGPAIHIHKTKTYSFSKADITIESKFLKADDALDVLIEAFIQAARELVEIIPNVTEVSVFVDRQEQSVPSLNRAAETSKKKEEKDKK